MRRDDMMQDDEHEPDPPEFDRSKVPEGPASDWFFDGRTGRGLTNAEYDEMVRRFGNDVPWPRGG